jgi:hypothetical protein
MTPLDAIREPFLRFVHAREGIGNEPGVVRRALPPETLGDVGWDSADGIAQLIAELEITPRW